MSYYEHKNCSFKQLCGMNPKLHLQWCTAVIACWLGKAGFSLSSQPCVQGPHVGNRKAAMVGIFTPGKLADAMNQSPSLSLCLSLSSLSPSGKPVVKHLLVHHH